MADKMITTGVATEEKAAVSTRSQFLTFACHVLPWIITGLIFYYIFRRVPFREIWTSFGLVRLHLFIPLVLFMFPFFFIIDSVAHNMVFNWFNCRTDFREVLYARGATYILNLLNFFVGQGGMAVWLSRKKKVGLKEATSSVIFLMTLDFATLMFFSTVGVVFFLEDIRLTDFFSFSDEGTLIRFCLITSVVLLLFIFIWIRKPDTRLARVLFRGPWVVFDRTTPRHFGIIFMLKVGIFIIDMVGYWLGLKTFGVDIPFILVFTYLPLIFLIGAIPITVLHLGTTQAAWLWFFRDYISEPVILAYTLLMSFSYIVIRMTVGLIFLSRVYREAA